MADENTIKEYLVSLGFKIDEPALKRFNTSLSSLEKNTVKFATTMSALTIAVVGGVAEIAKQFTTLYYVSERTGATVENLNALTFAGQQIGLSAGQAMGAIEGLARAMRMNPGITAYINSMGIKTVGRDASDVLTDIVGKLKQMYGTGAGFAIGSRIGQLLGIDPDTLLFLEKNYDELIAKQEASRKYYRDAGVDQQKAAASSRELINAFHDLEERLEPLGVLFEQTIIPYLIKFITLLDEGVDWIDKQDQPTKKWIVTLGTLAGAFGVLRVATFAFNSILRTLGLTAKTTEAELAGSGLWALFVRLGLIAATVSVGGDTQGNGISDSARQQYNDNYNSHPEDQDTFGGSIKRLIRGTVHKFTGGNTKDQLHDVAYFMSQGLSREQAIGIVANLQQESGLDPDAQSPSDSQGRFAYGKAQWRGARIDALKAFARSLGKSYHDPDVQNAFILKELREGQGGSQLAATSDIGGATGAFLRYFERPASGTFDTEYAKRLGNAQGILGKVSSFGGATGGGSSVVINQKTDVHVSGGDPHATGKAVASEQGRVNGDLVRNAAGLFTQ